LQSQIFNLACIPLRYLQAIEFLNLKTMWGNRMELKSINLQEKLDKFSEDWSPKIIAQMNGYHFKLVKIHGEFI